MVAFADLIEVPTLAQVKARFISLCVAAELKVTSWIPGEPSERFVEIIPRAIDQFLSNAVTQAGRFFFFDYTTDPGDEGDLSADQTPRPGMLSAFGSGWWGADRGERTFARGSITITNAGTTPATFAPYDLTFRRNSLGADGGYPTYRNDVDDTKYTGIGGTLTIAPAAFETVPIVAEQAGSYANAAPDEIDVLVTQSFGTLTVTNALSVLAVDRENRADYIARCRQQSAAASPNGPDDAYRYASTTGQDGKPLQLWDGSGATTVNRVYVSPNSSTGEVLIYLANPGGPATAVEVSSANGNINGLDIVSADGTIYNPAPPGVVPGTVGLGPTIADGTTGAPGPGAATATNIGPLVGTARIKAIAGKSELATIAAIHEALEDAMAAYFASIPIGGFDQVAGAGVVYRSDLEHVIKDCYPLPVGSIPHVPVLYAIDLDVPTSATSAITLGRVPVYVGPPDVVDAVDNGSGLIRVEVESTTGMGGPSTHVQIWEAEVQGGTGNWLIGTWAYTVIDPTHIDLTGSSFPADGNLLRATLSLVIVTWVS